jgi:hypothetical protein
LPELLSLPNLTLALDMIWSNSSSSKWNTSTISLSLEVTSATSTLFSYYHTAGIKNNSGTEKVGPDTIFRIASITEVFTALAVLLEARIRLEASISQYVPELSDPMWDEVNIGMLTSQLSGAPRDGMYLFSNITKMKCSLLLVNVLDLASQASRLIPLEFPPLLPSETPTCSSDPSQRKCTRSGKEAKLSI